ncbi:MAG: DUF3429 domain-containing protein [Xanthomonadales bacterium]|nr:DUF3429 domain-containing protein [Xanthomonadales bacterium]
MNHRLAMTLGGAGLLPFVGLSVLAMVADGDLATNALRALHAWGAVIASFLGGITWGTAVQAGNDRLYLLSLAPFTTAWVALLLPPDPGLWLLVAALLLALFNDAAAHRLELIPGWFYQMRRALSVVVIAVLSLVAVYI